MSTRCWIGQKTKEGIKVFYCHCDGYVNYPGVGYTLPNYYSTEDRVTKLVDMCHQTGTSSVEKTLEKTKKNLYEDEYIIPIFKTKKEYVSSAPFDIENFFLFENNEWKVSNGNGRWKHLYPYARDKNGELPYEI